jgi:hypothetical protein
MNGQHAANCALLIFRDIILESCTFLTLLFDLAASGHARRWKRP